MARKRCAAKVISQGRRNWKHLASASLHACHQTPPAALVPPQHAMIVPFSFFLMWQDSIVTTAATAAHLTADHCVGSGECTAAAGLPASLTLPASRHLYYSAS